MHFPAKLQSFCKAYSNIQHRDLIKYHSKVIKKLLFDLYFFEPKLQDASVLLNPDDEILNDAKSFHIKKS
ncbi:hypothetical protein BpHYR1_004849 [Brachionus plicatilis]|uniref:Uncharacterized protein n=1 Tax=Brachionus plicatilis TaxID=10195 RepID=A0A3M7PZI2_BRAPC|nr:hypothetical protein BpHYR1_004849 [Brachionus plicatilis]